MNAYKHYFQKNLFWINASVTAKPGGDSQCENGPVNNLVRIKFKFISAHRCTLFTGNNLNVFFYFSITMWRIKPQLEWSSSQNSYSLFGVSDRKGTGICQINPSHVFWQKNLTNPCSAMCGREKLCTVCYFMSHWNQGTFHFLGEILGLQGWLSMGEIPLGVVKAK